MRPTSATAARPSGAAPARTSVSPMAPVSSAPPRPASSPPSRSAESTGASRDARATKTPAAPAEQKILFQKFFKSVGPRTYAVQVKEANNGNHFLVVTEGKRDEATGEVRKTRLFVFSEDFTEFFDLLGEAAKFIKTHPVPEEVEQRRRRFWAKKNAGNAPGAAPAAASK